MYFFDQQRFLFHKINLEIYDGKYQLLARRAYESNGISDDSDKEQYQFNITSRIQPHNYVPNLPKCNEDHT